MILLPPEKRSLGQGNIFTGVCLSTGDVTDTPQADTPLADTPQADTPKRWP